MLSKFGLFIWLWLSFESSVFNSVLLFNSFICELSSIPNASFCNWCYFADLIVNLRVSCSFVWFGSTLFSSLWFVLYALSKRFAFWIFSMKCFEGAALSIPFILIPWSLANKAARAFNVFSTTVAFYPTNLYELRLSTSLFYRNLFETPFTFWLILNGFGFSSSLFNPSAFTDLEKP